LFTVAHVAHTLSTIALALYMLGVFNGAERGKEADAP
jgi:hypothetical protein